MMLIGCLVSMSCCFQMQFWFICMEVCIILMYAFILLLASVIFFVVLIELVGDLLNLFLCSLRSVVVDRVLFCFSRIN